MKRGARGLRAAAARSNTRRLRGLNVVLGLESHSYPMRTTFLRSLARCCCCELEPAQNCGRR